MKNKELERDIACLALVNKAIELNLINLNVSKDARYSNISTLLFNIKQTMEDGIREQYVDVPLKEIDPNKFIVKDNEE